MPTENKYQPSKVWEWSKESGGTWASINRPTAGARENKSLPVGKHPFQLYSMGTPNGQKVTILLEELLEAGESRAEYDAHLIKITDGDQFGSGFVDINPNSKIPALIDNSEDNPVRVFESGAILLYLADKFKRFIPHDLSKRTECLNWLFWQMGSGPYVGGGFGHFFAYAPDKIEYAIDRFTMETKRQLDVLDQQLEKNTYVSGDTYTIADMAIWPWYGGLVRDALYDNAADFLNAESYAHVNRWATLIEERQAVKRGRRVNRTWGPEEDQLAERHDAGDF